MIEQQVATVVGQVAVVATVSIISNLTNVIDVIINVGDVLENGANNYIEELTAAITAVITGSDVAERTEGANLTVSALVSVRDVTSTDEPAAVAAVWGQWVGDRVVWSDRDRLERDRRRVGG